jgi:hypothetical protein
MIYRVSVEIFFSDKVPERQVRSTADEITERVSAAVLVPMPKGAFVCVNGETVIREEVAA